MEKTKLKCVIPTFFTPLAQILAAHRRKLPVGLLIKGTSRREKVRKNLNPTEKSELAKHSRSRPSTYVRNIQKSKTEEKSWY